MLAVRLRRERRGSRLPLTVASLRGRVFPPRQGGDRRESLGCRYRAQSAPRAAPHDQGGKNRRASSRASSEKRGRLLSRHAGFGWLPLQPRKRRVLEKAARRDGRPWGRKLERAPARQSAAARVRARPGRRDRSSQRAGPMKRLLQKRLVEIAAAIVVWKDVGKEKR